MPNLHCGSNGGSCRNCNRGGELGGGVVDVDCNTTINDKDRISLAVLINNHGVGHFVDLVLNDRMSIASWALIVRVVSAKETTARHGLRKASHAGQGQRVLDQHAS